MVTPLQELRGSAEYGEYSASRITSLFRLAGRRNRYGFQDHHLFFLNRIVRFHHHYFFEQTVHSFSLSGSDIDRQFRFFPQPTEW